MRNTVFAAVVISLVVLSSANAKDYVILEVGDEKVQKSEVDLVWNNLFPVGKAPDFETFDEDVRQNILRGIVSERLLYKKAKEDNVHVNPEIDKQLETIRRKLTVKFFMRQKAQKAISDDKVKKAYDELLKKLRDTKEMKARHILVKDESDAKDIKKALDDGANFESLAKEKSVDKGSARVGGDLGWFTKDKMVPEFADAAFALDEGDISEPVKSKFGWHIIKAGDKRKVKTPTYSEAKEDVRADLEERVLDDYIEDLLDQSNVVYYDAKGNKRDFTKVPDSTKE